MSAVEKLSLLKRLWIVVEKETTFQRTSRSAQFGYYSHKVQVTIEAEEREIEGRAEEIRSLPRFA